MAQLSNIIISIVLLGLVMTGIGLFVGDAAVKYSQESLDDGFVNVFINESSKTSDLMSEAQEKMLTVEDDAGVLDRLASFFRGGYDAAKVLFNSFTSFGRMINTGVNNIPFLGGFGTVLSTSLVAIVLIILLVGILLNFLIKSDKT